MRMAADDQARLEALGLFDAQWYRSRYPDVAGSVLSPWEHFLNYGAVLGRAPGPGFDPGEYLEANDDVARAGHDPLLHYLRRGHDEGRHGVAPWVRARSTEKTAEKLAGAVDKHLRAYGTGVSEPRPCEPHSSERHVSRPDASFIAYFRTLHKHNDSGVGINSVFGYHPDATLGEIHLSGFSFLNNFSLPDMEPTRGKGVMVHIGASREEARLKKQRQDIKKGR